MERQKREKSKLPKEIDNNVEVTDELKQRTLELLLLGIDRQRIANILSIDLSTFDTIKGNLIDNGQITQEQIRDAITKRMESSKETIYNLLKKGCSYDEIEQHIPYSNKMYITRMVAKLKEDGRITEEEIEEARFARNEQRKKDIVLQGLMKGLTYRETLDLDENVTFCKQKYREYRSNLVASGAITNEQIEEARLNHAQMKANEAIQNYEGPNDGRILELSRLGFDLSQIARIIGTSKSYISKRRSAISERYGIDKKVFAELIKNREQNAEKRRKKIEGMIYFTSKVDENVINEHIGYTKAMTLLEEESSKDMKLIINAMLTEASIITASNLNFVLRYLARMQRERNALNFIDKCMEMVYDDDRKIDMLSKSKELIVHKMKVRTESYQKKIDHPIGGIKPNGWTI